MAQSVGTLFAALKLRDTFSPALVQAGKNLEKWSKKQKRTFRRMSDSGKAMTASITLPVLGMAAAVGKVSIDFESAFAGVLKTVGDATDEFGEMTAVGHELEAGLRQMATEMPITANELALVAENAGQLGIQSENILEFTEVMAKLGVTTNLSASEAAQALAKIANITQMNARDFDRLGSTVVSLGNNFATNEAEVAEFGVRLAGAATLAKMSQADFLAIGAALADVGVKAEAGGTAMSKAIATMQEAVISGGDKLEVFAATAGMAADEFQTAFRDDAAMAFATFIQGLGVQGEQAIFTLDRLGLDAMRTGMSLKNLAGAGDKVKETLENARGAWQENIALNKEAELRFRTTASKLKVFANNLTEAALVIGDELQPAFDDLMQIVKEDILPAVREMVQAFADLTPEQQKNILKWIALAAVIGPVIVLLGQAGLAITGLVSLFGVLTVGVGRIGRGFLFLKALTIVLASKIAAIGVVAKVLGATFLGITAPVWGWIAALVAAGAAIWTFRKQLMNAGRWIGGVFGLNVKKAADDISGDLVPQLKLSQLHFEKLAPEIQEAAEGVDDLTGNVKGLVMPNALPSLTDEVDEAAEALVEFNKRVKDAVDEMRGVPARAELKEITAIWNELSEAERSASRNLKIIGPRIVKVIEALGPGGLNDELFQAYVAFHNLNRDVLPRFMALAKGVEGKTGLMANSFKKAKGAASNLFGSFKTGIKDMWAGMSGGQGFSGLMGNIGKGLSEGIGSILSGGLSSLVNMGVGLAMKGVSKLGSWIGGLFGRKSKEQKEREAKEAAAAKAAADKVREMRRLAFKATESLADLAEQGRRTGQIMPEHLEPYLQALRNAKMLTEAQSEALLQAATDAHIDFDGMKKAAEKYGIALSDLGPAFDIQRLHRAAEVLANDWEILIHGGANVQAVIAGMGDEVQALVTDALKAGKKIPQNLQPIVEKMIEAGKLTDENGNKFTDLSQVQFALPITEKFDALLTKLDELIDRIAGPRHSALTATEKLVGEILNIPDAQVRVMFDYDIPNFSFDPQTVNMMGFQGGTHGFRDFGAGTPVMLHGREAVVPEGSAFPGDTRGVAQMDRRLASIERLLRDQPRALGLVVSDSLAMVR